MVRKGINLPTLQTEQVKRYSALAHLGVKNMLARARQVASKNLPPAPSGKASQIYALRFG
ncbi:MAG: hypothetical protein J6Y24_04210 [Bacteroidales bacterium]|nr:hypothetical protein [Bacteroidales bacterium]